MEFLQAQKMYFRKLGVFLFRFTLKNTENQYTIDALALGES